jgi:hypothetical protein
VLLQLLLNTAALEHQEARPDDFAHMPPPYPCCCCCCCCCCWFCP